jgi:hypothetical protein
MRITKMLFTLGLVLLLAGCGPEDFLNPLYTENDLLVSDPLLPGTWERKDDDGTMVLEFQSNRGGCYTLNYSLLPQDAGNSKEQKKPFYATFDACLVELGQTLFLDLQPDEILVQETTETFQLTFPPHPGDESPYSPVVLHIDYGFFVTLAPARGSGSSDTQSEYELRLTLPHWIFRIWIDATTLRLRYFQPQGDVENLSTENLQKLVLQYADDSEVFSSLGEWQRKDGGSR